MRIHHTLLLTGVLVNAVPAGAGDAKKDQEQFQGTWETTELVFSGKSFPKDFLESEKVVFIFTGDKLTSAGPEVPGRPGRIQYRYKLDPQKKPRALDMTALDGPDKGKTFPGIYQLEAGTLKLCFADPAKADRPTKFASPAGSNVLLLTLRRVKP